jgi:hypothetical protein
MLTEASEMAGGLPPEAVRVLELLAQHEGRLPLEDLIRRFGPLREMGPGRRDRERPWASPVSPLEVLWYRGILARAFADTPDGPLEYGFVPSDLANRLLAPPGPRAAVGKPAPKPRRVTPADSVAIDDATTLLAAYRREGWKEAGLSDRQQEWLRPFLLQPESLDLLLVVLDEGRLLPPASQPEAVRAFLEADRSSALAALQSLYLRSPGWNDLARTGSLRPAGRGWPNDPAAGRRNALGLLASVPRGRWWSTAELIAAAREAAPHFLRPPGGIDSWYLQRASDGAFLRGFESWEAVEGELLRYLLNGPLHWLGAVDRGGGGAAFRWTAQSAALRGEGTEPARPEVSGRSSLRPDGTLQVARLASRALRYQVARLCSWEQADPGRYTYRFTAGSLRRALTAGLTLAQARQVLEQASEGDLPQGILRALERWGKHGQEARVRPQVILEVQDASLLDRLMAQASTGRFVKERLGPTMAAVEPHNWQALRNASLRLGLLIGEPEERSE